MVAFTSPMSTNSKKSLRFRSKKKITLKIDFEINSDFWSLLFMIIPPNFLCTPLYFYSLFLCFSLLYFCTFFLLLFSFCEKKKFPLIFIFVTHFPSDFVHIYFCYYCWKPSNKNLCYLKRKSFSFVSLGECFFRKSRKNRRQDRMCEVSPNKILML